MILSVLTTYYPVVFVVFFLVSIGFLVSKFSIHEGKKRSGNSATTRIDELMHNRNSGVPISCMVDSMKSEKIEYRGVEERA